MIHKYLAYLKTIETGSITQAAAELGYTQSAVSRMIADLEEHWDVPLLTRNRSGIERRARKPQSICPRRSQVAIWLYSPLKI